MLYVTRYVRYCTANYAGKWFIKQIRLQYICVYDIRTYVCFVDQKEAENGKLRAEAGQSDTAC